MAITYTIGPAKGSKFGVYVRALSGNELAALFDKMPELWYLSLSIPINKKPKDDRVLWPAVPIKSNRLGLYSNKDKANSALKRFKSLSAHFQVLRLKKLYMKALPDKHFEVTKLQYFKVEREFNGNTLTPFTTQNKEHAERTALHYSQQGNKSGLVKTIGRHIKGNKESIAELKANGQVLNSSPKGGRSKPSGNTSLQGICKDIKDQGPEMLRRISQKRKRTTTNTYWNNR